MYKDLGYMEAVAAAAEESMQSAVTEVTEEESYNETGEVIIAKILCGCMHYYCVMCFCSGS